VCLRLDELAFSFPLLQPLRCVQLLSILMTLVGRWLMSCGLDILHADGNPRHQVSPSCFSQTRCQTISRLCDTLTEPF